jgi:hypothetical protein
MLWNRTKQAARAQWVQRTRANARPTEERGAIAVISVMVAMSIFGVAAITVDLSNSMQLRRKTQNAADAASIAGSMGYESGFNADPALELPGGGMSVDMTTRESNERMREGRERAFAEIKRFANVNFRATADDWAQCRDATIADDHDSPNPAYIRPVGDPAEWCIAVDDHNPTAPIIRVRVPGKVDLSFGRVISDRNISVEAADDRTNGFEAATTTTTTTTTTTVVASTTSTTTTTNPAAPVTPTTAAPVTTTTTTIAPGCPLMPIAFHGGWVAGNTYDIFSGATPGNFGWLSWAGAQSDPTLITSLTLPGNSDTYVNPFNSADHVINIGDWIVGSTGVQNSSGVRARLNALTNVEIIIPQWGAVQGTGSNTKYQVLQFLRVKITSYRLPGQNRITAQILGTATC